MSEPSCFALLSRLPDPGAIRYSLDATDGPFEPEVFARAFQRASGAWEETGLVGFRQATADDGTTLFVSWQQSAHGTCRPFGIDSAVAHTTTIDGTLHVHLDADRTWKLDGARDERGHSLHQTLLHELGHVLGLGHTPDDTALLAPDTQARGIERADLDGVRTLYSSDPPGPNDYVVVRGEERVACIYGVRVEDKSAAQFFDTDGDGKDELLVWRRDPEGFGLLTAFFFDEQGRPYRTMGPRYGMVDGTALVSFVTNEAAERLIVLDYPNGTRMAYVFGGDPVAGPSIPTAYRGTIPEVVEKGRRRLRGDLDGDGTRESTLLLEES